MERVKEWGFGSGGGGGGGGAWDCPSVDRQPSKCSGVIRSWRILGTGRRGEGVVKLYNIPEDGRGAQSNVYIDEKGIGYTYIIKYFILTCKAFSEFSFHEADHVKNLRCQVESLKS